MASAITLVVEGPPNFSVKTTKRDKLLCLLAVRIVCCQEYCTWLWKAAYLSLISYAMPVAIFFKAVMKGPPFRPVLKYCTQGHEFEFLIILYSYVSFQTSYQYLFGCSYASLSSCTEPSFLKGEGMEQVRMNN